jgi:hypothetical protein
VGLQNARGGYTVLMNDDLLVPASFLRFHLATLEAYPDA